MHPLILPKNSYEQLKAKIIGGHLGPGKRLTEEHLAKELGVSRTPIREAIRKLEAEGLIKPLAKRGFVVAGESKEEVEELFEIRAVLEGYSLRVICGNVSEDIFKELNRCIHKAEEALRKGQIERVFIFNTRFHDTLHNLVVDKDRLHRLMVDMRKNVLRYRINTLHYPHGGRKAIDGHRKIVLSLRLGDPELCERLMREHIQEAKADALRFLFKEEVS
jgi:DNA-binding GntR family transcriptional regulator